MKARLLMIAAVLVVGNAAPAAAQWCSFYDHDTYNCGFRTFEQCLANISGVGGICRPNVQRRAFRPGTEGRGPAAEERRYRR